METQPAYVSDQADSDRPPYIIVQPVYKDPQTGATFVHGDLVKVQDAWAEEGHIGPVNEHVLIGDVESFCAYVARYSGELTDQAFVSWNLKRLSAVLDYHGAEGVGRCQWRVEHAFKRSREWEKWGALCSTTVNQLTAVERLEELADGVIDPVPAQLMAIIRGLKANVKREAVTEFTDNGDTKVSFTAESSVRSTTSGGATSVTLPSELRIRIPVLHGHTTVDANGRTVPVVYDMTVKLRVSADDDGHVQLRFSMPTAEKVLEEVIIERVASAKDALVGLTVYRAAD